MNKVLNDELFYNSLGVIKIEEDKYVETLYSSNLMGGDNSNLFEDWDFIEYDFTNLDMLCSSFDTTYLFIDREDFSLKAFTGREPEKVVELEWNMTELIDDLEADLLLFVEEKLKEWYNCREATVCVVVGYYTKQEIDDMLEGCRP